MKELLEELDAYIFDFEQTVCCTVGFYLYIKENGLLYLNHWNGEFQTKVVAELPKLKFEIDLKPCDKTFFMLFLEQIIQKHSNIQDKQFYLFISNNDGWDSFVWNNEYKFAGQVVFTSDIFDDDF